MRGRSGCDWSGVWPSEVKLSCMPGEYSAQSAVRRGVLGSGSGTEADGLQSVVQGERVAGVAIDEVGEVCILHA